jgi:hypothetical protein
MSFSWRQINLFGIAMGIPVIAFLIRKSEEQITAFGSYHDDMASCNKCHRLFNGRAGVRFIMHLKFDHGISEDNSIAIVADLWKRLLILKWSE